MTTDQNATAGGAVSDPCLAFVNAWNAALAENEAVDKTEGDEAALAHWQMKVVPFAKQSERGDAPAATTREGAIAALQRVLDWDDMEEQDAGLIRSALAFLMAGGTPVTIEWLAAQDFEAWVRDEALRGPPSNQDWNTFGADMLPTARLAWGVMFATKAELVSMAQEDPDAHMQLTDSISCFLDWMQPFQSSLNAARWRLNVAAAVAAQAEPEAAR